MIVERYTEIFQIGYAVQYDAVCINKDLKPRTYADRILIENTFKKNR